MERHAKRVSVPPELRQQIKHEQGCCCGMCQAKLHEQDLYIHHIKPVSHFRRGQGEVANRRENLIALCEPCHTVADELALGKRIYLRDIVTFPLANPVKANTK